MENQELNFFDSHAHYYDDRFYGEENTQGAEALLDTLFSKGLLGVINVGTNPDSNRHAIEQAAKFKNMYAAVGLHPEDFSHFPATLDQQLDNLQTLICDTEERKKNKIVAIGEIGLDYYWEPYDKQSQAECFCRQLQLADSLSLPVIIHDREAHGDCFDIVCKFPNVKGVFHSYSGSAEMARELVRRGWYISFSGVVSFKNAIKVKDVARVVPNDKILIETDAPYLAPHPHRGKINHSGRLIHTAEALAEARGCSVEEISKLTYLNALQLFNIEKE